VAHRLLTSVVWISSSWPCPLWLRGAVWSVIVSRSPPRRTPPIARRPSFAYLATVAGVAFRLTLRQWVVASLVYRQSEIKGDVFVVLRHVGSISGVAAHEDEYIATAGDDGRVILWEKATGKSVSSSLHDDVVNDCAFSRDGRYLVTSSSDCTARLWSVPDLSLKAMLADHGDDVTMSAFHPVDELIATASRGYFVRVYDFHATLVATFGGSDGDVVWLDWTHDGRELVALSDDGKMTRWPWATTQSIDAIGLGSAEYSDSAPADANGVSYGANDCGQADAVKNRQATRVQARDTDIERLVIDPQKSLLACVSDGTLAVWDIATPPPTPIAATTVPDDVWARSCAFAGASRLVFGTFGAGYRTYDYLRDEWLTGDIAPTNGISTVRVRGNNITRP
jgi:toxoflavin biosynthesis protein ToxC